MQKPDIVVIGSSNTDMVIKVPRIPRPGETILGGTFIMAAGGKGANQAVAASKLGGNVTFIARVGKDIFGKQALQDFNAYGINTKYIIEDDSRPSGVALIFVDSKGENTIAVASGANSALQDHDLLCIRKVIQKSDVLLMQLEIPLQTVQYAVELASESDTKVILNPAPAQALPDSLLCKIDMLTPNESEAQILTGIEVKDEKSAKAAAVHLRGKGVSNVIVTMGAKGSMLVTDEGARLIPTKKVEPLDTTAAGDAFNGALAYFLGNHEPLIKAVHYANMVGALSVTKMGAQPSMPSFQEFQKFINE